jgi:hypothetical protein
MVAALGVPGGQYVITAIVPILNNDTDDQTGWCALSTVAPFFGPDGLPLQGPGVAVLRLPGFALSGLSGTHNEFGLNEMTLVGTANISTETVISVSCMGFNWDIINAGIFVTKVGFIH